MPVLPNARHERFAQALSSGMSASEAYKEAGYKADDANAARLTRNDQIRDRVAELLEFSLAEGKRFLADIIRTPIGKVDANSHLCQERTYIEGQEETSVKVKMPSKLDAFDKIARLLGWYAAEKIDAKTSGKVAITIRKL